MRRRDFCRLMSGAVASPTFTMPVYGGRPVDWHAAAYDHDCNLDISLAAGGVELTADQAYLAYLRFSGIELDRRLLDAMLRGIATGRFAGPPIKL